MDKAEPEWTSPLLPSDFGLELASGLEANHKTKEKDQTQLSFSSKSPIKTRQSGHLPILELFKANLLQNKNKPQNSARVDIFIFIWETLFPVGETPEIKG